MAHVSLQIYKYTMLETLEENNGYKEGNIWIMLGNQCYLIMSIKNSNFPLRMLPTILFAAAKFKIYQ